MSKILIVGNVLKDVYLKLDEAQADFEEDARGINWLDLAFNGGSHTFFHRTSVYGGAGVSLTTLSRLGLDVGILNSKIEVKNGEISWSNEPADYRYILSYRGGITYFAPSERKATDWAMPKGTPEWLLVDRSTQVSARLVDEIKNFLKFSPSTKLAVHAERETTPDGQKLMEMADILFVEDEPAVHVEEKIVDQIELDQPESAQLVCHISPRKIMLGEAEESWSLDRADMMTHLTVYSTIVATVLGVIIAGGTAEDALLIAKLNAEHATLDGALTAEKLQELMQAEKAKRANLRLITRSLMEPGKGILALDEERKILTERFNEFGVANSHQKVQEFYQMLLGTPRMADYTSGVMVSDENAGLPLPNGQTVVKHLTERGIIPGLRVDEGLAPTERGAEWHARGVETVAQRLNVAYVGGFRFAGWHAMLEAADEKPSFFTVEQNADELAQFAKESQLAGLVPVIEVDLRVKEGELIEHFAEVTARALARVFEKMAMRRVDLASCLLKLPMMTGMVDAKKAAEANEIGLMTAEVLRSAVPKYLGGVLMMDSGLEPKMATKALTAVAQNSPFAWPLSFAFARVLEEPVLATWKGEMANVKAAQAALVRHLAANADALHYAKVIASESVRVDETQRIDVWVR